MAQNSRVWNLSAGVRRWTGEARLQAGHSALLVAALLGAVSPASAQTPPGPANSSAASAADGGIESRIRLRPIDRASVRIVQLTGASSFTFNSRMTAIRRTVSLPEAGFGTGVVVGPEGLVLTAAHVVRGGDVVAVLRPGADEPQAARVIYSDSEHDLAVLVVDGELPDRITLPTTVQPLTLSQRLFATGYPLAIQERYPAAVSGELSRENNDGSLQVAMSVNPGNSGGPVIDEHGALVGIMARRGEPTRGVEGIALLEPLRFVLPAVARARQALAERPVTFQPQDRHLARVLADFVRTSSERPIFEQTAVATLDLAAANPSSYEAGALVAAHAWNMQIALLEARNVANREQLGVADRALAERLNEMARRLADWALAGAPYLTVYYSGLRGIRVSNGQPWVPLEDASRQN